MRPPASISAYSPRAGVAGTWVAIAFVALAGSAALVIDLGTLVVAAQRCQDVADSAALAAGTKLPNETAARQAALATTAANNSEGGGWPVVCRPEDCEFFSGPDITVDGIELGPYADAMRVTVRAPVHYTFARILGVEGATAVRSATILRAPVEGIPLCTMWIAHNTPMTAGAPVNLLMADGPHCAGIPGSFGFLQAPAGCSATSLELLRGYDLSREDIESSFVNFGDSVWAQTGLDVGTIRKALVAQDGTARIERADAEPRWADDTWDDHEPDNPRIMLIPLVTYLGGTGSNAEFRIDNFGAFWLDSVNAPHGIITGCFIHYDLPGGDPNSTLTCDSGIYATKLVH